MRNSIQIPLSVTHPELCLEWSDKNGSLTPDMFTYGSNDKVWWKGKCGHEWEARICNRASKSHTGCPYCTNIAVLKGFNDLAKLRPDLAAEWSEKNLPLTPDMFRLHSGKKVIWKCKYGHEWTTAIGHRARGRGCPICSNVITVLGVNDIVTRYPIIARDWSEKNAPLKPEDIRAAHKGKLWWKCQVCGKEYQTWLYRKISDEATCPYCTQRKTEHGFNDISTSFPSIAAEWDYEKNYPLVPECFTSKSRRFIWWKCPCGHSWGSKIKERTLFNMNCKTCTAELKSALPELLTIYYAENLGMEVNIGKEVDGVSYETYIPYVRLAIELEGFSEDKRKLQTLKKVLSDKLCITYITVHRSEDYTETAKEIKSIFSELGVSIKSDIETDISEVKRRFNELRKIIYDESKNENEDKK